MDRYAYFESRKVQERILKSDKDLKAGRYAHFPGKKIDKALEWLKIQNIHP